MKASTEDLKALYHKLEDAAENFATATSALHRAKTEHDILQIKYAKALTGKDVGDYINTIGGRGKIDSVGMDSYFTGNVSFKVFLTKKNGEPYKVTRSFLLSEIMPDEE